MRSASLVVVQVHLLAQVPSALASIDELAGELEAVAYVVRTTTPFPVARRGWCSGLVGIVAGARLDAAFAAGSRDAMSHGRARDGVDEGGLSASSIHDLAEQIFPTEEILGGAVPSAIAKLMLALGDRLVRTPGHGHQYPWVFPGQSSLLSPQGRVDRGIHVQGGRRHRQKIVRLSCLGDPRSMELGASG